MAIRHIVAAVCSIIGLGVIWSCPLGFTSTPLSVLDAAVWQRRSGVIPGGTDLKHCEDPLDPTTDLLSLNRVMLNPNSPVVGRNLTISATGRFKRNISTNATTFYFIDADHASLVGYGSEPFCNLTKVVQTIDGLTDISCPPVEGHAFMQADVELGEYWPTGDWFIHIDARNGTDGKSARLSCIEGNVKVRPKTSGQLWRSVEMSLPRSFWSWREGL